MPISNIQGYELQEKALNLCQGFIGIASSLCDSEKVYRNILNFLLGRIVVVDNLDNAALIAKKFSYKFKIVTLDGQVINFGGALTGGEVR
ncbi:chromosome segregation protein SMC [Clostridium sp. CAG:557]|nr:chromosome segregation protein SMC [Clostridium sp. CAG:557]